MTKRLPASMRTREELSSLIEGRLSTASAKDELVKLATRLVVEEALEGEAGDAVGRDYYEHGAAPGQGYRNGYRMGRLKTAEGLMEYSAPQIAGRDEPFQRPLVLSAAQHAQLPLRRLGHQRRRQRVRLRRPAAAVEALVARPHVHQRPERFWDVSPDRVRLDQRLRAHSGVVESRGFPSVFG